MITCVWKIQQCPYNINAINALYIVSYHQTYTYFAAVTRLNYCRYEVNFFTISLLFSCLIHTKANPKPLHPRPPTLNTCSYINKFVHLRFIVLPFWISTFNFWYCLILFFAKPSFSFPPVQYLGLIKSSTSLNSLSLFHAKQ